MHTIRAAGRWVAGVYKGAGVLLLNVLLCWVCVELASTAFLRVYDSILRRGATGEDLDPRSRSSYYDSKEWASQYWREFAASRRQRYQPFVLWKRAAFHGATINVDEDGIRQTPGAACNAPNASKVFVLGGSTVWGTGSPDWGTLPAYLQVEIQRLSPRPICVVNFGESAYVSTQSVLALLRELQAGNVPDVVISYDGTNDVYSAYQSGEANAHQNLEELANTFERREGSALASLRARLQLTSSFLLASEIAQRIAHDPAQDRKPLLRTYKTMGVDSVALSHRVAQTYLRNCEFVRALAHQYGFDYTLFWPPHISTGKKPLTDEEKALDGQIDPDLRALHHAVSALIEGMGARHRPEQEKVHSLADVFDAHDELLWLDESHVTPVGNEILARRIVEVLNEPEGAAQRDSASRTGSSLPSRVTHDRHVD